MTRLTWSDPGTRVFESGLDRGVLYTKNKPPTAWNGLTSVDENGGEGSKAYFLDGRPFLYLPIPKEFSATIKAFTYPDEFSAVMGLSEAADGMYLDSQSGQSFDLCYRTQIGDALTGQDAGYKIHLIYNATVAPSQVSYASRTNSIDPVDFSWDINAVPEPVAGYRPTAHIVIDTRHMTQARLATLEDTIYGTAVAAPSLPKPQVIFDLLSYGDSVIITDNLDGTWTAEGSYERIINIDADTFQINGVEHTVNGNGTIDLTTTL